MRWEPEGPAWQYVMLDKMPASIDPTLIEENLKRTPAERLQALQAMVDLAEEIRRAREDRAPKAHRDARPGGWAPRAISMTLFGDEIKIMALDDLECA